MCHVYVNGFCLLSCFLLPVGLLVLLVLVVDLALGLRCVIFRGCCVFVLGC